MSKYSKKDNGYWWLHLNGTLQYSSNCHGMDPNEFFNSTLCVNWWNVRCELDWYRMLKEWKELVEGISGPIVA